jgi:hypothetical protein
MQATIMPHVYISCDDCNLTQQILQGESLNQYLLSALDSIIVVAYILYMYIYSTTVWWPQTMQGHVQPPQPHTHTSFGKYQARQRFGRNKEH